MDQENWLTSRPQSVLIMYILCENIYFTPSLNLLLLELYRVITGVAFRNDKDILTSCCPASLTLRVFRLDCRRMSGVIHKRVQTETKWVLYKMTQYRVKKLTPGSIFCHDLTDFYVLFQVPIHHAPTRP